jgi:hypothetical protein
MVDGGEELHTELHETPILLSDFTIRARGRQFNRTRESPNHASVHEEGCMPAVERATAIEPEAGVL